MKHHSRIKISSILISILIILFSISVIAVESNKTKYEEMDKEEIDEDDNEVLKEYYGTVVGASNKNAKFNTISTKDSIAILNVTIDGKDRRILTRLNTGTLYPGQYQIPDIITTTNIIALGNISYRGSLFNEVENSFGTRRLFSAENSKPVYTDEGYSRLIDGKANVSINSVMREIIGTYSVFLSAEGLTKGIYVAEKTDSYFIVKSVNPKSSIRFAWLLRGVKTDFEDEHLKSYSNLSGISIKAVIDYESQQTIVTIQYPKSINSTEQINNTNQTQNNLTILTGNIILEEDLSSILDDLPQQLPNLSKGENIEIPENENNNTIPINETTPINETETKKIGNTEDKIFILSTTDENSIIERISEEAGLTISEVKKLITFVYKSPEEYNDEDFEAIESPKETVTKIEGIENLNGSIIITLG